MVNTVFLPSTTYSKTSVIKAHYNIEQTQTPVQTPSTSYNFTKKNTFITQLINKIIINKINLPLATMRQEYNYIRYELSLLNDTNDVLTYQIYQTILLNI